MGHLGAAFLNTWCNSHPMGTSRFACEFIFEHDQVCLTLKLHASRDPLPQLQVVLQLIQVVGRAGPDCSAICQYRTRNPVLCL